MGAFYSEVEIGIVIGFSSFILGITIAYITGYFSLNRKYKTVQNELNSFKRDTEKALFYSENRKITHDLEILEEACKSESNFEILILGINALGILHQGYEKIIEILNKGKTIKILLLEPDENGFFGERVEIESINDKSNNLKSTKNRLTSEWNTSLMILADISQKSTKSENLYVKKYYNSVKYGMTSIVYIKDNKENIDFSKSFINCYTGEGRGYQNRQCLCRASIQSEILTYKKTISDYNIIWNDQNNLTISDFNGEIIQI